MEKKHLDLLINIDSKIDDVKNHMHAVELVQTRMESDLKYHIKRTDLLEEKIFHIDEKFKPIENAKHTTKGIFRIVTFAMALCASLVGIINLIKLFKQQ